MTAIATSLFFLFVLLLQPDPGAGTPQSDALLQLKKSLGNAATLSSWTAGTDACSRVSPWWGVVCFNGIVTGLRLGSLSLSGTIDVDALRQFPGLRSLSFQGNSLSGPFPNISEIRGLKSIFFHDNRFSGPIPSDAFAGMTSLKKIWLAGNKFSGSIPDSLTSLPHLMELRLENNAFSGSLPSFNLPSLKSLNVSNNQLTGNIPAELLTRFDASSFSGNPGLGNNKQSVATASSTGATLAQANDPPPAAAHSTGKGSVVMVMVMIAMLCLVLCAAARHTEEDMPPHVEPVHSMKMSPAPSFKKKPPLTTLSISGTELFFLQEKEGGFVLLDLMRAAAEVLGSDELGSSYKAVLTNGRTVVVKRMKEMTQQDKEGFHTMMCRLGKIRHENVLPPVAYHYRREEKLLVCDYATKGNLLFLLHGDRGPHRPILEWQTRIKIAQGIARGFAHLHAELSDIDLPHGNLKSTNVLFSDECEPLIADFGFSNLINPALANQNMVAFRSPEFVETQRVCHKSDVWCLGIVILEIITGKFPSQHLNHGEGGIDLPRWVRSELAEAHDTDIFDPEIIQESTTVPGEMRQLLEIALACTEPNLGRRLDMATAHQRIEDIKIDGDQHVHSTTPSLIGGLSASQKNTLAVFSSRWSASENLISLSNLHDDNLTFAIS